MSELLGELLLLVGIRAGDRSRDIGTDCSLVVEGTVCPISFVKDVLFPYALRTLPSTLATQWDFPAFQGYRNAFPPEYRSSPDAFRLHAEDLMSRDLKIPYLKSLQGYLWLRGYESGYLRCPLFPDVAPAMSAWYEKGIPILIYSSGSVAAQKLLFQYTDSEPTDLRGLIMDYFDTTNAGMKTETGSYAKITEAHPGHPIGKWLFLSDNVKEVEAARGAGMQSFVVVREGNVPLSEGEKEQNVLIKSFDEIHISKT